MSVEDGMGQKKKGVREEKRQKVKEEREQKKGLCVSVVRWG